MMNDSLFIIITCLLHHSVIIIISRMLVRSLSVHRYDVKTTPSQPWTLSQFSLLQGSDEYGLPSQEMPLLHYNTSSVLVTFHFSGHSINIHWQPILCLRLSATTNYSLGFRSHMTISWVIVIISTRKCLLFQCKNSNHWLVKIHSKSSAIFLDLSSFYCIDNVF